ncbi:MAG: GGDEF domain-containing protein, partial [Magnetospirillum sp.]|nr:GGDEF domain-containing protein [Magnetospirillum sp.]
GVLLPETTLAGAAGLAERLRVAVTETFCEHEGKRIPLAISVGVAIFGPSDTSVDSALSRCDEALYAAKRAGRNQVVVAST